MYIFFGICTTLVNVIVYYICAHIFDLSTALGTALAWFLSVLFAYITNKIFVFESKTKEIFELFREICSFFICRVTTGIVDLAIMLIFVDVLHINDLVVKIVSNILVIVLNYLASKLIIFRKR